MNNNIFIAALFCFSLIFSPSTMNLDNKVYSKVKEEICNIEEYGMKIEYITDKNIKDQFNNISDYIKIEDFDSIVEKENEIYLNTSKEQFNLDINLIEENSKSRVQIVIVSKNRIDFNDIKEYFQVIHNKNMKNIKYYTYIKGNIRENNNIDEIEEKLIKSIGKSKVKESKRINLEKGTTGIINLKSDYQFNYSIMTYEEDRKLILGTPIIFTTY
ncbi:hypothetical protein ACRTAL_002545 [Clostridium perfringens]|uniref:TATA-box binding protein n=3 Tax=Clostridium perfringens TaxID=1502 RepID=A0A2X2Y0A6_CLOPF|nr:hypothetical protein [Clostridium perfringens]ALG49787.1 hypothetical protein FORC3_2410 [Clostridium perfringens]AXH53379.1 hypothetical protein C8114_12300 [Clostridium perfringens]EDS79785.1 conserved hypothetical protein [Clostridium perfringens C str. JGS1495]EDT15642.1 conserved hypothetical protein [Clostridium perfringens E str. JGS1987]EHK2388561.1 hypothetical protein [Clostridium perfringens]